MEKQRFSTSDLQLIEKLTQSHLTRIQIVRPGVGGVKSRNYHENKYKANTDSIREILKKNKKLKCLSE
jgi:hypothetical protein